MKMTVSEHAKERAVQHLRIDRRVVEDWIRSNVRKAQFISSIVSEEGKECRLFAFQRVAFVLDAIADHVITLYPRHHAVTELYEKIKRSVMRELVAAERKEKAAEQRFKVESARIEVEKAQCRLRMAVTPSEKVIVANERKIAQLDEELAILERELIEIKREKSSIARSVVMFL